MDRDEFPEGPSERAALKYKIWLVALTILMVSACTAPVYPEYSGPESSLGLIGVSSYAGQQRIFKIESINGKQMPNAKGRGVRVPQGDYWVSYRWGHWGARTYDAHSLTFIKVKAGKCYQPWFEERRRPAEKYLTGNMICWDQYSANGDGTYRSNRMCEPMTEMRYPVDSNLVMQEFPKGHDLCKDLP